MKIKDVIQESAYDWFTQRDAARTNAGSQQQDRDLTMATTGLLKKAVAFFQGGGPALTPQDQQMIAQIDQARKTANQPAIDWRTGKVVEPTGWIVIVFPVVRICSQAAATGHCYVNCAVFSIAADVIQTVTGK